MRADAPALAAAILFGGVMTGACAPAMSPAERAIGSVKIGDEYAPVRQQLIAAGWRPVPARCSEQNICFGEMPEMATSLSKRRTCGVLRMQDADVRICLRPVPDGALVESIEPLH